MICLGLSIVAAGPAIHLLPAVRRDIRIAYGVLCGEPATRVTLWLMTTERWP